ncbi:probable subunit IV of cytochrome c oxidase [Ramularia collo-cygni]|uniref:Cytochrome c oxidase subunit 4, mitochondrial n=1 Tax=Ramularia collo-cygni TaxID=112498 RepID=A0A2D3VDY3_9PEZI|nr:probable subunit IV of cytochrome c oxidase [Ramularia collo-cygni]CZT25320.1 probable subunit IV of cytochrome c oxidase [Ramularia collo-cygni]
MFLRRAAPALAKRAIIRPAATRSFALTARRTSSGDPKIGEKTSQLQPLDEIKSMHDLMPAGGKPGTIPTDLDQATGLERLEILGKMQGIDVFDMRPLDASRKGTLDDPITVKSFGDEQYLGCTGFPVDTHNVIWLTTSRDRPIERCPECGSVYKLEYVGPQDDGHGHHDHGHGDADGLHNYEGEPKTMADFVRPEYR